MAREEEDDPLLQEHQLEALDEFFFGVGLIVQDDELTRIEERHYGTWKIYCHYAELTPYGNVEKKVIEIETTQCMETERIRKKQSYFNEEISGDVINISN